MKLPNIYKVFYFPKSGRNLIISFSSGNYSEYGIEKPHQNGCCREWAIHIGKLHIDSSTPKNNTEI